MALTRAEKREAAIAARLAGITPKHNPSRERPRSPSERRPKLPNPYPKPDVKPNSKLGARAQLPVPRSMAAAEFEAALLALKRQGMSHSEVAAHLNVNHMKVANAWSALMERMRPVSDVEAARQVEAGRLDELRATLWQRVTAPAVNGVRFSERSRLEATETYIRLSARYSKLLGLDAPQRHEIDVQINGFRRQVVDLLTAIADDPELMDVAERVRGVMGRHVGVVAAANSPGLAAIDVVSSIIEGRSDIDDGGEE